MTTRIKTYSVPEAAEVLRVTPRTLSRLVRRGQLRKVKVGSRTVFRETELERFLERNSR